MLKKDTVKVYATGVVSNMYITTTDEFQDMHVDENYIVDSDDHHQELK